MHTLGQIGGAARLLIFSHLLSSDALMTPLCRRNPRYGPRALYARDQSAGKATSATRYSFPLRLVRFIVASTRSVMFFSSIASRGHRQVRRAVHYNRDFAFGVPRALRDSTACEDVASSLPWGSSAAIAGQHDAARGAAKTSNPRASRKSTIRDNRRMAPLCKTALPINLSGLDTGKIRLART